MATQDRTSPQGPSLAGRFALAIALTVGFYALALGMAAFLIGFPIWAFVTQDRIYNIWLEGLMVITGIGILRAVMPRRVPFTPDGIRVEPGEQPRLREAIADVAREVGDTPPDDVYLTLDVNAAVTQTGGPLGSGGRRVLFLGLPLMRVLSLAELRGVIAHEYGHYVGGDTRLGAWTYRTRLAVGRTLDRLSPEDPSWFQKLVRLPFQWYAKAFMRVTSAISRRQEFAADALAARVAGRSAHRSGLEKIHATAPAYDAYFEQELVPVLNAGHRPPVADGFDRFLGTDGVRRATDEILAEQLEEDRADPYSSHPSLPQRLDFLEGLPGDEGDEDPSGPALELVDDVPDAERRLLRALASGPPPMLEPIAWDDVAEAVYLRDYRELVAQHGSSLGSAAVGELPASEAQLRELAERLR